MSLVYNINRFQNAVSHSFPFGEVRRGSSFNAFNCMKAYSFNGERYGYYGYDASGERTYKYDMYSAGSWTNEAGGMNVSLQIDKMMLYPNGYLNMNQNGEYTKHYYADALRIASKIGNGFSQDLCTEANQIGNKLDSTYLDERGDRQYVEMKEELSELIHGNQVIDVLPIPYPDTNLCNLSGSGIETALFFYHPDHLGSTGMVTDNSSNITQGFLYAPFGEILSEYNPGWQSGVIPKNSFNAKELDEENGMYYYSARYYAPPTFISRDPMFEKYPSISPYTYCMNNPVKFVDPTGQTLEEGEPTDFKDDQGNLIKHVDDGSNAVFTQTGSGVNKHYAFTGYDESQGGTNDVNLETAIQEQQQLNNDNPSLQQNGNTTYCNYATQNVMKTVGSTPEGKNALVTGRANQMIDRMLSGNNPNYIPVSQDQAEAHAADGGLAIVGYRNPNTQSSGHVATFTVGNNRTENNIIANIGLAKYTGFVSLNSAISKSKPKSFFIYIPGYVGANVNIKPK
jgi:RHS repeat-associated protein